MTPLDFLVTASAVADPTRWRMLSMLHGGPLCVSQLADRAGVTPSAVSYHVRRLGDAGLVVTHREGRRTVVRRVERRWQTIVGALTAAE